MTIKSSAYFGLFVGAMCCGKLGGAVHSTTKILGEFEASLKKFPPIAPGTPDPYAAPSAK